jgi:Uma2 family endonuclease
MSMPLAARRFTVEEYHRMAEVGILAPGDRSELLDGEILALTPVGARHAACVKRLIRLCAPLVVRQAVTLSVQDPVILGPYDEPQPDVALLRYRADDYAASHPTPADVLLLIEVADTSLDYDRQIKLPRYARSEVPEVWLVNLEDQQVEIYREPAGERYAKMHVARRGEALTPLLLSSASVSVDQIVG